MAYYKDLTPYEYFRNFDALNIGWLSKEREFEKGDVPDSFIEELEKKQTERLCRGSHGCEFCEEPKDTNINSPAWLEFRGRTLGNGEIIIKGKDGKTYSSPVLIVHYIKEHNYKPPKEYINAVIEQLNNK